MVLAAIVLALYFGISRLVVEISSLIQNFPEMYAQLEAGLRQIGDTLYGIFERLPKGVQNGWTTMVENLDQYMGDLVSNISEPTVTAAGNIARRVPYYLISFLVSVLSAYFFIVQREEVLGWMKKVAPEAVQKRMTLVMDNLRYAVGGYFKAQFKIMVIVFLILLVGLGMLGTGYFVLVAFLIAFLDFLPFFGTGTAMIPWAVYKFFMGDYKMTVALVIIYVITQAVSAAAAQARGRQRGPEPAGDAHPPLYRIPDGRDPLDDPGSADRHGAHQYVPGRAFDYIFDDIKILVGGILGLHEQSGDGGGKSD